MHGCFALMFVCVPCLCLWRVEKGISSSGTLVIDVVSHLTAPGVDPGSFGRATSVINFLATFQSLGKSFKPSLCASSVLSLL